MDKEKLKKAAYYAYINADFPDGEYQDLQPFYVQQFQQGAHWLLSQPLGERLTEEEKVMVMQDPMFIAKEMAIDSLPKLRFE